MVAYAVRIAEENMQAIVSEHPRFDKEEFLECLEGYEVGYFLRDPSSVFDCKYFDKDVFLQMYTFEKRDNNELFRTVRRI